MAGVCLLLAALAAVASAAESRRFGFVALILHQDNDYCSASIPSTRAVLSSAQCRHQGRTVIWAGRDRFVNDSDFAPPAQHRTPSRYVAPDTEDCDVMIVVVNKPWVLDEHVSTVSLDTAPRRLDPDFEQDCTVVGFGRRGMFHHELVRATSCGDMICTNDCRARRGDLLLCSEDQQVATAFCPCMPPDNTLTFSYIGVCGGWIADHIEREKWRYLYAGLGISRQRGGAGGLEAGGLLGAAVALAWSLQ